MQPKTLRESSTTPVPNPAAYVSLAGLNVLGLGSFQCSSGGLSQRKKKTGVPGEVFLKPLAKLCLKLPKGNNPAYVGSKAEWVLMELLQQLEPRIYPLAMVGLLLSWHGGTLRALGKARRRSAGGFLPSVSACAAAPAPRRRPQPSSGATLFCRALADPQSGLEVFGSREEDRKKL